MRAGGGVLRGSREAFRGCLGRRAGAESETQREREREGGESEGADEEQLLLFVSSASDDLSSSVVGFYSFSSIVSPSPSSVLDFTFSASSILF